MAATLGHFEKSAKYIKEEQGETLFLLKKLKPNLILTEINHESPREVPRQEGVDHVQGRARDDEGSPSHSIVDTVHGEP